MGALEKAAAYIEMEDYLVLERHSSAKHEYLKGVVYTVRGEETRGMAGGTQTHARVIRNTLVALHARLSGSACEVLGSEMRLRIDVAEAVFYSDILVHCTQPADPQETVELTEARLVVEVLSFGTQVFDRGSKLTAYRQLPGLQHIVLVSSLEQAAWACHRDTADGPWSALQPWPRGTVLALPSLAIELPWGEIYDGVGLP